MAESDADEVVEESTTEELEVEPPESEIVVTMEDSEEPGEPESTDEAKDDELEQQAAEGDEAEAKPPEEPGASDDAQKSTFEPFSFKVDGDSVDAGVLTEHDDGQGGRTKSIVIPHEKWEAIHRKLASRTETIRLKREAEDARDPTKNEELVRANAVIKVIDAALESPEAFQDFYDNFDQRKEGLGLKADNAVLKAQALKRTTSDERKDADGAKDQRLREIEADLPSAVTAAITKLGVKLSKDDEAHVRNEVYRNPERFYFNAVEGDGTGLTPGQLGRSNSAILESTQAQLFTLGQRSKGVQTKADAASERNRKVLEGDKKIPKTPPATGGEPLVVVDTPIFENKKEYKAWIDGETI